MFALNQGEVCTCPSRALIQADIFDEFLELAAIRTKAVRQGDPLDTETMIGAQASNDQLEKILSYIEIGKSEGAQVRDRRGARRARRRPVRRLLRAADDLHRRQQDAGLPGGDLRAGGVGDVVHRLRRRHLASPTTPSTASAPGSGRATATPPTGPGVTSKPAGCGPTATTPTPPTRRSAATSSPASAGRTTR